MSENEFTELSDELSAADAAAIDAWLSAPDLWDGPDEGVEDDVVAAIIARAATETPRPEAEPAPVRAAPRRARRRAGGGSALTLIAVAAALALIVVVAAGALRGISDRSGEQALALKPPTGAAPPLAPDATGDARIDERGDGTRIRLDVRGLPPAPPGSYYEAWMRKSPQVGVSAGTFHLREGGHETIELWSGVSPADYPLFTITIQEEAKPESSGKVLLSGRLG
jgi:hypothetical protein